MPRTHYFPDDRVHFTWDTGNEPVIEIEYLLCSLVVDLKSSEVVDVGQYVVSALLPDAIFAPPA